MNQTNQRRINWLITGLILGVLLANLVIIVTRAVPFSLHSQRWIASLVGLGCVAGAWVYVLILQFKRNLSEKQKVLLYRVSGEWMVFSKGKRKAIPFHPFLFGLFPVFSLYFSNYDQVTPEDLLRPAAVTVLLTIAVLGLTRLVLRSWQPAGLITSLFLLMFFSYGYFVRMMGGILRLQSDSTGYLSIWIFWVVAFMGFSVFLARSVRRTKTLTVLLNVISLFLFLLGSKFGVTISRDAAKIPEEKNMASIPAGSVAALPGDAPDIYYLIFDAYGRSDVLRSLYKVDSSDFTQDLESMGFYIAQESFTNYPQTVLSLGSSLNMEYLDGFIREDGRRITRSSFSREHIQENHVMQYLGQKGYKTYSIDSGYNFSQVNSQVTLDNKHFLSEYERIMLAESAFKPWMDKFQARYYREQVHWRFDQVGALASEPGPKFVFAHFIFPHTPFVFNRNGDAVEPRTMQRNDGSHYTGANNEYRADYLQGYAEQLPYANILIKTLLKTIIDNSERPPVIIIQGDHGPGAYLNWEDAGSSCLLERLGILNAYYLPGIELHEVLYPQISPVNTFRLVFNEYFGEQFDLLPDQSFFTTWSEPFKLMDVTEARGECAGAP